MRFMKLLLPYSIQIPTKTPFERKWREREILISGVITELGWEKYSAKLHDFSFAENIAWFEHFEEAWWICWCWSHAPNDEFEWKFVIITVVWQAGSLITFKAHGVDLEEGRNAKPPSCAQDFSFENEFRGDFKYQYYGKPRHPPV